jgi:cytochrome c biogenesis protein CcmG/thiol:disulfide interchange protein DsbE
MRKNTIWLIVFLVFLVAAPASAWFWDKKDVEDPALSAVVKKMPDFSEANITAEGMVNSKDFAGKVLLVNFWATTCPPCREEIPSLMRLQEKYKDKGFSVIGISMDEGGRREVSKFIGKLGVNYPVFIGNAKIGRGFGGIMWVPVTVFVDREGNLVKRLDGFVSEKVLTKELELLFE